jgi:hypothetical protein
MLVEAEKRGIGKWEHTSQLIQNFSEEDYILVIYLAVS